MKRAVVSFLTVVVLLLFSVNLYIATDISKRYASSLSSFFLDQAVTVHNSKTTLINTYIDSYVVFRKENINKFFGDDINIDSNLEFFIKTKIPTSIFDPLRNNYVISEVRILSPKELKSVFLDSDKILDVKTAIHKNEIKYTILDFADLSFQNRQLKTFLKDSNLTINLDDNFIKSFELNIDEFSFASLDKQLELSGRNLIYTTTYKDVLNFDKFILEAFKLREISSSLELLNFKSHFQNKQTKINLLIERLNYNLDIDRVNIDKFDLLTKINSKDINLTVNDSKYSYLAFNYEGVLNNQSRNFYKKIRSLNDINLSKTQGLDILATFMEQSPKLYIKDMLITDNKNNSMSFNFYGGLENFTIDKFYSFQDHIFLNGNLKFDEAYLDNYFLEEEKESMSEFGIFKKVLDKFEIDFIYDKFAIDIVINESFTLREFLQSDLYNDKIKTIFPQSPHFKQPLSNTCI